jgi:hypothetical protein
MRMQPNEQRHWQRCHLVRLGRQQSTRRNWEIVRPANLIRAEERRRVGLDPLFLKSTALSRVHSTVFQQAPPSARTQASPKSRGHGVQGHPR